MTCRANVVAIGGGEFLRDGCIQLLMFKDLKNRHFATQISFRSSTSETILMVMQLFAICYEKDKANLVFYLSTRFNINFQNPMACTLKWDYLARYSIPSLSIYLYFHFSVSFSFFLCFSLSVCLCLSVCLSFCLSVSLSLSLSLSLRFIIDMSLMQASFSLMVWQKPILLLYQSLKTTEHWRIFLVECESQDD